MTLAYKHLYTAPDGDTKIVGTGLRVYTIIGRYEMGSTAEYIARNYDVPLVAVFEALAYGIDHPEEMEAMRHGNDAAEWKAVADLPDHLRSEAISAIEEGERARLEAIRRAKEQRLGSTVSR
jgi:uncharacterized protein (DUF433 family)